VKRLVDRTGSTGSLPVLLAIGLAVHGSLYAQETNAPKRAEPTQATTHIIVKWSSGAALRKSGFASGGARAQKATALAGVSLTHSQDIGDGLDVMQASQSLDGAALDSVIARLQADPDVEYASPDLHRYRHALTTDPLLPQQWYLLSAQPAATRTEAAWDITQGDPATIVAVLDTGVRAEHPDLAGKLLSGYDFITNTLVANDGDGRDPNPEDTGDWLDSTDKAQTVFKDCDISENSSWHGTRVAGLIAAATNNLEGVAGTAWNTRVLPVRVLGKCGGFDSDIIAGMRWAAGLTVTGVPVNPTPAKVINLSLGGKGACTAAYQAAVNEVVAKGVLIVASAGNEGGPVDTPANCSGVLGVAGIRHTGTKVGYSSLGPQIGLSAPGGNCVNPAGQPCLFSIVVPVNSGKTVPGASTYTDQSNYNVGTSFSAPMAAGAAALMNSVNSALTPAQSIVLLKASATPFPTNTGVADCHVPVNADDIQADECACTTSTCGAGMLNIGAAVAFAVRPFGVLTVVGSVVSGGSITASAVGSFASNGHTIGKYEWSVVNLTGTAPLVMSPSQLETTVQIAGDSQFTLRLMITDEVGGQDIKEVALSTPAPAPSAPATQPATAPAPSKGGGGGQLGCELLAAAAVLTIRRWLAPLALSRSSK